MASEYNVSDLTTDLLKNLRVDLAAALDNNTELQSALVGEQSAPQSNDVAGAQDNAQSQQVGTETNTVAGDGGNATSVGGDGGSADGGAALGGRVDFSQDGDRAVNINFGDFDTSAAGGAGGSADGGASTANGGDGGDADSNVDVDADQSSDQDLDQDATNSAHLYNDQVTDQYSESWQDGIRAEVEDQLDSHFGF